MKVLLKTFISKANLLRPSAESRHYKRNSNKITLPQTYTYHILIGSRQNLHL